MYKPVKNDIHKKLYNQNKYYIHIVSKMSKVFLNDKKTMNIENREKKQVIISYKSYAV